MQARRKQTVPTPTLGGWQESTSPARADVPALRAAGIAKQSAWELGFQHTPIVTECRILVAAYTPGWRDSDET